MFDPKFFVESNEKYVKETLEGWESFYQETLPEGVWSKRKENALLFIDRILEVYKNDRQTVYNSFDYFYSENAIEFLDKLLSFVGNYFFDDSYFSIKFYGVRKSEVDSSGVEEYEEEPWKDFTIPKVVGDENGMQDPTKLLELLDWLDAQKVLWNKRFGEIQEAIRKVK